MNKLNGNLFVIVGASGVGKDTLLNEIRDKFKNFYFVKRYITRTPDDNNEDHVSISDKDFQKKVKNSFFTITWDAHSLSYGIPKKIDEFLKKGTNVIFNGSRHALKEIKKNILTQKLFVLLHQKKILKIDFL